MSRHQTTPAEFIVIVVFLLLVEDFSPPPHFLTLEGRFFLPDFPLSLKCFGQYHAGFLACMTVKDTVSSPAVMLRDVLAISNPNYLRLTPQAGPSFVSVFRQCCVLPMDAFPFIFLLLLSLVLDDGPSFFPLFCPHPLKTFYPRSPSQCWTLLLQPRLGLLAPSSIWKD